MLSTRRAAANLETESKQSDKSKVTSMNDLTLSADADSDSSSDSKEARNLSKPRSHQEAGKSSGSIGTAIRQ